MLWAVLSLVTLFVAIPSQAFTPYHPTNGWTYHIEAVREEAWPSCAYRFLSYPSSCDKVDLWNAAGGSQEWTLHDAGDGNFYLKSSCGSYLSYPGDCSSHVLDMWPEAGINQKFKFIVGDNTQFEYYIEAVGRSSCDYKYASFPVPCTTSSPDKIDLWSATGPDQRFRLFPVRSSNPAVQNTIADGGCADPYAWWDGAEFAMQCTQGGMPLYTSSAIGGAYKRIGDVLGGTPASWAANSNRWAPENVEVDGDNYVFFADAQSDGIHRMGWARSTTGVHANAWDDYAASYLNLGNTPGGEIDGSVFVDDNGATYLFWKSDDNNAGDKVTRIWAQQMDIANGTVTMLGSPQVVMDSTGLWWADSFVSGGSLVEAPEVIHVNGYYYLFFAAGKFCQDSYSEGVARSTSLWGPYEKMGVQVVSTGLVGTSQGQKLVGPGHATLLQDGNQWYAIWHASVGYNCNRYPFIGKIAFGSDKWPYVEF